MMSLGIDRHASQLTTSLRDESGDVIQARQAGRQFYSGGCVAVFANVEGEKRMVGCDNPSQADSI